MTAIAAQTKVSLLLHGPGSRRVLELLLDSVLGQTRTDFCLFAGRHERGQDASALLDSYNDPRFVLLDDEAACLTALTGGVAALVPADAVLLPAWLARLMAALEAAPAADVAVCHSSLYDGISTRPAPALPEAAAGLAQVLRAEPALLQGALFRTALLPPGARSFADIAASLRPEGAVGVADRLLLRRVPGPPPPPQRRLATDLFGRRYTPAAAEAERPPTLFVVVDTEAEFDWDKPFAPTLTAVSALSQLESAQSIFDRYGLRPVYLIDYPVASQPEGVRAIGAIVDRGGAAVGAHLHPWTNPPLNEPIDRRLSFPGNLPPQAEAAKLDALLAIIERNFGERPLFYKAGRYGLGPNTAALIASRGAKIDFSLLPETDLRDVDGPDFRMVYAIPYDVGGLDLLAVPMTRADVGPLSRWWRVRGWLDTQTAALLHVRAFLVRAGLLERLTLTPEGVEARLQVVLLQTLLRRGHRLFVLHFHSPSLAAGHTPYVRNETERAAFVARIDTVCRWFFEELGGVPGRPWDLLPTDMRKGKARGSYNGAAPCALCDEPDAPDSSHV